MGRLECFETHSGDRSRHLHSLHAVLDHDVERGALLRAVPRLAEADFGGGQHETLSRGSQGLLIFHACFSTMSKYSDK